MKQRLLSLVQCIKLSVESFHLIQSDSEFLCVSLHH